MTTFAYSDTSSDPQTIHVNCTLRFYPNEQYSVDEASQFIVQEVWLPPNTKFDESTTESCRVVQLVVHASVDASTQRPCRESSALDLPDAEDEKKMQTSTRHWKHLTMGMDDHIAHTILNITMHQVTGRHNAFKLVAKITESSQVKSMTHPNRKDHTESSYHWIMSSKFLFVQTADDLTPPKKLFGTAQKRWGGDKSVSFPTKDAYAFWCSDRKPETTTEKYYAVLNTSPKNESTKLYIGYIPREIDQRAKYKHINDSKCYLRACPIDAFPLRHARDITSDDDTSDNNIKISRGASRRGEQTHETHERFAESAQSKPRTNTIHEPREPKTSMRIH